MKMAASSAVRAPDGSNCESGAASRLETNNSAGSGPVLRRDPTAKLLSPFSGLEPLAWSEDHRLSACTKSSISLMEIVCEANTYCQDLVIHRASIPVPEKVCVLKVGPEADVLALKENLAGSKDPFVSQGFVLDRVMNPNAGALPPPQGLKYASWSPLGCDTNGRCLLASLTLDGRLTVHGSSSHLQWVELADLTQLYGRMLEEKAYSLAGTEPTLGPLGEPAELRRRYRMQAPVRIEWSRVCTVQQVQAGTATEARDTGVVLLAVLMENGDLVVWQLRLPFRGPEQVVSCSALQSGVQAPSALAWWEYEHGGRRMSGLIVGSSVGPVKILPVNLKAIKGHFTLRQPVVLWQEVDHIPVNAIKCVSVFHPHQKHTCSLVLVARGPYLFWCLMLITKAGLNVHNSHVVGLHSAPIISMATSRQGDAVFTCSLNGAIKKLTPVFTDVALTFRQVQMVLPEGMTGRMVRGIAISPNGAYFALATTEGMTHEQHPVTQSYQVQFITLKTPEEAAAELLDSPVQNLFQQADLLDLLRWKVLRDKRIPPTLQAGLEAKMQGSSGGGSGGTYPWRFALFLYRVLFQSLQKAPTEARWRPMHDEAKVGEEEEEVSGESAVVQPPEPEGEAPTEEQVNEIATWIEKAELHITWEHMKKVLGEVYLNTSVTENTSIPTRGLCDFLSSDSSCEDRAAKVLVGHIFKKMNKQTFPEYCSLCKEVLPFSQSKQTVCSRGHLWLRCVLTYQACQSLRYRRCLQRDSIARHAMPEDPDWIKRILQGPCSFCDSPLS